MEWMLTVAGFVLWLLVAVAIGSGLVFGAAHAVSALWDRYERLARASERRECGNRLVGNAWWFSEDSATMNVLMAAGQDMLKGIDPLSDVSDVREKWRKARAKPAEEGQ